jgi:hypothetical protein
LPVANETLQTKVRALVEHKHASDLIATHRRAALVPTLSVSNVVDSGTFPLVRGLVGNSTFESIALLGAASSFPSFLTGFDLR